MADIADSIQESLEGARESRLNALIAVTVAVTATFMAVCNVKSGNVVQSMAQLQTQIVNQWSYFQAKSTKQLLAANGAESLAVQRDTTPGLTPEGRVILDKAIVKLKEKAERYETEKNEIKADAEKLQGEYEAIGVHDDQFDMAEACLSVAIALFGITALTQKRWLFGVGAAFGGLGLFMGLAAFAGSNFRLDFFAKLLG